MGTTEKYIPLGPFFLFFGAGWSSARLAIFFIRAWDAALFRSVRAARRFLRSLIRSITACCYNELMRECTFHSSCLKAIYRVLRPCAFHPSDGVSLAFKLFLPFKLLFHFPLLLFLLLCSYACFVTSFRQPLLPFFFDLVVIQLGEKVQCSKTAITAGGDDVPHYPEHRLAGTKALPKTVRPPVKIGINLPQGELTVGSSSKISSFLRALFSEASMRFMSSSRRLSESMPSARRRAFYDQRHTWQKSCSACDARLPRTSVMI